VVPLELEGEEDTAVIGKQQVKTNKIRLKHVKVSEENHSSYPPHNDFYWKII
jgi:hypothetical protein